MGLTEMQELLSVAMANLPPGFRFHPTDEEVFVDYLAGGRQELIVIPEIDICMFEPELLPNQFKERSIVRSNDPEGWFVCKQEQGQKARRSTREGFWKITGRPSEVKYRHTNQIVGFGHKRFLTFYKNVPGSKAIKTNWVMHEYYLPNDSTRSSVICHVMLKEDDKAISRPGSYLPLTEPHLNGSDSITQVTESWSISCPSISSRSERVDLTDIFDDSEPEHCNLSEDQIQMKIKSFRSLFVTPNDSISRKRVCVTKMPRPPLIDFDFRNDIGGIDDQIIPHEIACLSFCEEDTFIRENTQTQKVAPMPPPMVMPPKPKPMAAPPRKPMEPPTKPKEPQTKPKEPQTKPKEPQTKPKEPLPPHKALPPKTPYPRVCVFDEAERGFVQESSNHTYESKLEGYGENSVPVNNIVSNRSSKLHNEFIQYEDSSLSKDKKIKMEIEPFIVKAKEVKKHATASSCLAYKKSKYSSQETRINCKTESMMLSSPHDLSCFSTPPICYLINFLVGIALLIFFIDQVF